MADKLGIDFAIIHRKRKGRALTAPEMEMLVGDVEGKVNLLRRQCLHPVKISNRSPFLLTT